VGTRSRVRSADRLLAVGALLAVAAGGATSAATSAAAAPQVQAVTGNGAAYGWAFNGSGEAGAGPGVDSVTTPSPIAALPGGVRQVAGGTSFSVALLTNGTVQTWGSAFYGTLGDGTIANTARFTPLPVPGLSGITQISVGAFDVLAVGPGGSVWAWGLNNGGQLGDGTTTTRPTPFQVPGLSGIVQVAAGVVHSLALRSDGTVLAWGSNVFGQLGDGTSTSRLTPVPVPGLTGVTQIAAGTIYSMAVRSDATLWTWGSNATGELGLGDTAVRRAPVKVPGLTGVSHIAGGNGFSLAVADPGRAVWAWGFNDNGLHEGGGQLGDGTSVTRLSPVRSSGLSGITQVAANIDQQGRSAAVGADGSLWVWGSNGSGHLASAPPRRSAPHRSTSRTCRRSSRWHSVASTTWRS
jgi:alpha-tubulin suppressor-like RCC1 family protein